MDLKKINFIGKLHCPNCGCMYIIIDNEILSCPVCEVLLAQKGSNTCEEDADSERISSIEELKFNKTTYF